MIYIVKTANAPTSPNPRYTFKPGPVLVAALAFVAAVLLPLLVPVAVPVATLPAVAVAPLLEGPGVCTGPAPLPPFQYGAQGLVSVASAPVTVA